MTRSTNGYAPNDKGAATDVPSTASSNGLRALGLISVVLPAFNEEAAIGHDLDTITNALDAAGADYEIIVVDDGSTDGTAEEVAKRGRVRLVSHGVNRGVGAARTTGMRAARGNIILTTDSDGTYPNHEMPRLLAALLTSDMVIGARQRESGTLRWLRVPAKAFIRGLASYLTGVRIPDLNSGLRCFRKDVAEQFIWLLPQGHSWESTITLSYLSSGYMVRWLPVDYYPRMGGRSSFHPVTDTISYLRLVARTVMYFNPLRIFGPMALLLLAAGTVLLLVDAVRRVGVSLEAGLLLLGSVQIGGIGLLADLMVKRGRPPR